VLVTPAQPGPRESGSGFVVQRDGDTCHVVTCHHVVRDWPRNEVQVNGRPAEVVAHGEKLGIDLAVLSVREIGDAQPLPLKEFARPGTAVYGYSFRHLHGDHYVRARLEARVSALLHLQGRTATRAVEAWQIKAVKKHAIRPGDSGAPLMEARGHRVVGIVSHAWGQEGGGIAISPGAVHLVWNGLAERRDGADPADARLSFQAAGEGPPEPPAPTDPDDPQRDRFGGEAERGGRELVAILRQVDKEREHFYVDLQVRSTDGTDVQGPARFFLHDTYARERIWVRRPDPEGKAITLRDVYSYGVYTVGCQVRDSGGHWVGLEYDLARLPKLPKVFLER
jgi:hypothetical protein